MEIPEIADPAGNDALAGFDPAASVAEIADLAHAARNPKGRGPVGPVVEDPGSGGPGPGNDPMAGAPVFNETACRVGIGGLVGLVESGLAGQVRGLATKIGGPKIGERFAERAGIQPEVKSALVDSAVEVCRTRNLSIGPEATLLACLAKIGFDHSALLRELRALAAEIKADPAFRQPPADGAAA